MEWTGSDVADDGKDRRIRRLGVVGAGAMGSGIAQVAATGGMQVTILDQDPAAVTRALEQICARIARLVEKGRIDPESGRQAQGRLAAGAGLADLAGCDLVVEAIVERLEAKQQLFTELEAHVAAHAILASNTSSLSIGAIARACRRPERVAGMHFFNPVPVMKLVELIAAPRTAPWVLPLLEEAARRMGRTPVAVRDMPGFLVNLGGRPYAQEALHILNEGVADAAMIDVVMQAWGFPLGPFALMDLTGMDVNFPVSEIVHAGFFGEPRLRSTPRHRQMREAGLLGRKTGQGFYRYDDAGKPLDAIPAAPAPAAPAARVVLPEPEAEPAAALAALLAEAGVEVLPRDDGRAPLLAALLGEDATSAALRLGVDPARLVALDPLGPLDRCVTLMMPPGSAPGPAAGLAAALVRTGRSVAVIGDSPGFIGQRIVAMIANLGCEMAQMGLAAPEDIDRAMTLGLNYPAGPLELAARIGPRRVLRILENLQAITGDMRYRPSLWLRRRALLGLDIRQPDRGSGDTGIIVP